MDKGTHWGDILGIFWGYTWIMENKMETTIQGLLKQTIGVIWGIYPPIMKNQMEKKMEHDTETGDNIGV